MPIPDHARVVVTGAGSGLGRALSHEVARRGGRVLCADIDEAAARKTADEIGAAASAARCDVAQVKDLERLADSAEKLWGGGGVDVIVNNAGVAVGGNIGDVPLDDWRWIIGVNLFGVVHGCHVFVPRLRREGRGHVLNIASAAGLLSPPGMGPYNATKAAVVALSETLRAELDGSGVGVTVLCPTFFRTNIHTNSRAVDRSQLGTVEKLMDKSKIQADDVARLALDACARNELYALPHADGRWLWRLKRFVPTQFGMLATRAARRFNGS
jgi:NAD(P)-dependent dehydrogenase (short-subunit alcohol dehydrogenase family)